jgi:hypothetical protein
LNKLNIFDMADTIDKLDIRHLSYISIGLLYASSIHVQKTNYYYYYYYYYYYIIIIIIISGSCSYR